MCPSRVFLRTWHRPGLRGGWSLATAEVTEEQQVQEAGWHSAGSQGTLGGQGLRADTLQVFRQGAQGTSPGMGAPLVLPLPPPEPMTFPLAQGIPSCPWEAGSAG